MVQLFVDNRQLIYDPFLVGYELMGLTATTGVNKGGTAEIVMPPRHPAYDRFVSRKTIVTIYRNMRLVFRGRALYPQDDFYGTRTITCEGERCFFCDSIVRPYLWQTDPATIFRELVSIHNAQVDEARRFVVGEITVSDPNEYVRLESENAETSSAVLDKLVERVGGYITFTDGADGERVINWLETLSRKSKQRIEFGENLLDFASSGENEDYANCIIPYGAKDEATGKRITIASVNGGRDYLLDETAEAMRGRITVTVTWDGVTLPQNLLNKARQELNTRKLIVSTLTLSAVDLSALNKDIDTFEQGDWVEVYSPPHGVDSDFLLSERKYDFLNPDQDTVTMGKQLVTLTGADVSGDWRIQSQLAQTATSLRSDVQTSVSAAQDSLTAALASKVNSGLAYMTSDGLLLQWGVLALNVAATTTASSLSLRTGPSTDDESLATLAKGETVTVTTYGSDWCAVIYGELSGYIATRYLYFGAATTSTAHVTFAHTFNAAPSVQVTAIGTTPGDACSSVSGVTALGADVHVSSGVTMVNWLAIGKAGTGGSEDGETTSILGAATLGTMILGG